MAPIRATLTKNANAIPKKASTKRNAEVAVLTSTSTSSVDASLAGIEVYQLKLVELANIIDAAILSTASTKNIAFFTQSMR